MHERLRDRFLESWARAVTRHPVIAVTICLAVAILGGTMAVLSMEFDSDRSNLIAPSLDWNQRYADYKRQFPRWDDVLVCIEGDPADRTIDQLVRTIASGLELDARVIRADAGFDPLVAPRLFQFAPEADFQRGLAGIGRLRTLAGAENVNAALASLLAAEAGGASEVGVGGDDPPLTAIETLLDPYLRAAGGDEGAFALPGFTDEPWQPLVTGSGRIRLISIQFAEGEPGVNAIGEQVAWLRGAVRSHLAEAGRRELAWGVTGIPVIEADETAQSMTDSTRTALVALFLIVALMFAAFRGLRAPALATLSLLIGMGWSFGWVVLSIGHLQLLSVFFSSVQLGLGVDFALHVVARLELIEEDSDDLQVLMPRVFRAVGPGLITGAITTALGFIAIALTDFTGAGELGIIAAGGVLLCLVAILSTFPAFLALAGKRWKQLIRSHKGMDESDFLHRHLHFVHRRPGATLLASIGVVALLAALALRVHYDPNVLHLQPDDLESVRWEERLIRDDARSAWAALVVCLPEEAADLTRRLNQLDEVATVGGMGAFAATDAKQRAEHVLRAASAPAGALPVPAGPQALAALLRQVESGLRSRASEATGSIGPTLEAAADRIREAIARGDTRESQRLAAWEALNESFLGHRESIKALVEEAFRTGPLHADDLPAALRSRFVGRDGEYLLLVQPAASGGSVLDPHRLGVFIDAVRSVAPEALGPPIQIHESSRVIRRAYALSALYALPVILLCLLFDFRSPVDTLCAMTPVAVGFASAFGLMGALGVPLNFANMIVLPMLLGVSVDTGVHIVHRWREEPWGRPAGLSGGTGRGVTLTMLTTIFGFGALMLAEHRGIRSLGFVMSTGLLGTMLASYTILPAILHLRNRRMHGTITPSMPATATAT